ncbi:MAG: thiamine diphosphokinase [Lachnospiraceae bacterium]|jgi:thiamine pyrophosphokinase
MNRDRILIVCGGECGADFLNKVWNSFRPDLVIAADGALRVLSLAGRTCDIAVGDFDTVEPDLLSAFVSQGTRVERHPPEKDETDSELAMRLALQFRPLQIRLLGALGGRFDHALVNVRLLPQAEAAGARCIIEDRHSRLFLLRSGGTVARDPEYRYFSLFPMSDRVENLCITGTKYELRNYTAKREETPGFLVSDEIVGERALVTYDSGVLLAVLSRD